MIPSLAWLLISSILASFIVITTDVEHDPRLDPQAVQQRKREIVAQLVGGVDGLLRKNGVEMVHAAYSSGKPAFGVGTGNVQCLVDRDADLETAIPMIIAGRAFDNGIICAGEQTAILPKETLADAIELFRKNGAHYVDAPDDVGALRSTLFPDGVMNKDCVGQDAATVAKLAGIEIPADTRIIVAKPSGYGVSDVLSGEKMCPVLTVYDYDDWKQAVEIAKANLLVEGKGHSVCMHSHNRSNIEYAVNVLPVSRFTVNQVSATSTGGSLQNGLAPTNTLGCGSWGGNSISENLSWRHLFNTSRIACPRKNFTPPSDEEIWA